jgi:hypothetical protein
MLQQVRAAFPRQMIGGVFDGVSRRIRDALDAGAQEHNETDKTPGKQVPGSECFH